MRSAKGNDAVQQTNGFLGQALHPPSVMRCNEQEALPPFRVISCEEGFLSTFSEAQTINLSSFIPWTRLFHMQVAEALRERKPVPAVPVSSLEIF